MTCLEGISASSAVVSDTASRVLTGTERMRGEQYASQAVGGEGGSSSKGLEKCTANF